MQERAEATRRYLVESAARLFEERGYAGTSISDISALSGRTSGAIYFHFASKEKLALAVVEATLGTWPDMIAKVRAEAAPALDTLVSLSFAVARAFRDDVVVRAGSRLWMERKAIDAPVPGPFGAWIATVTDLLRQAAGAGELAHGVDPDTAALTVVYAFFGLHTVSDATDGRAAIEDRLREMWQVLLPALRAVPAPPAQPQSACASAAPVKAAPSPAATLPTTLAAAKNPAPS